MELKLEREELEELAKEVAEWEEAYEAMVRDPGVVPLRVVVEGARVLARAQNWTMRALRVHKAAVVREVAETLGNETNDDSVFTRRDGTRLVAFEPERGEAAAKVEVRGEFRWMTARQVREARATWGELQGLRDAAVAYEKGGR